VWTWTAVVLTSSLLVPPTMFHYRANLPLPAAARWSASALILDLRQMDGGTAKDGRQFERELVGRLRFDTVPPTAALTPRTKKSTRTAIVLTVLGAVTFVWLYAHCFYRCK
jgi:hypothetical protein